MRRRRGRSKAFFGAVSAQREDAEGICKASGTKEIKKEAWQRETVARPYHSIDVEVIQQILNGSETTFAGLMDAARQPGALSDGWGIKAPALRAALNDLSALRLVGAEKRGRHVYYFMTGYGADLSEWVEALGLSGAAA
jgi:hypothetical protein